MTIKVIDNWEQNLLWFAVVQIGKVIDDKAYFVSHTFFLHFGSNQNNYLMKTVYCLQQDSNSDRPSRRHADIFLADIMFYIFTHFKLNSILLWYAIFVSKIFMV